MRLSVVSSRRAQQERLGDARKYRVLLQANAMLPQASPFASPSHSCDERFGSLMAEVTSFVRSATDDSLAYSVLSLSHDIGTATVGSGWRTWITSVQFTFTRSRHDTVSEVSAGSKSSDDCRPSQDRTCSRPLSISEGPPVGALGDSDDVQLAVLAE